MLFICDSLSQSVLLIICFKSGRVKDGKNDGLMTRVGRFKMFIASGNIYGAYFSPKAVMLNEVPLGFSFKVIEENTKRKLYEELSIIGSLLVHFGLEYA